MSDRWLGRREGKEIYEFSQSRDYSKFKFHVRFSTCLLYGLTSSPCVGSSPKKCKVGKNRTYFSNEFIAKFLFVTICNR